MVVQSPLIDESFGNDFHSIRNFLAFLQTNFLIDEINFAVASLANSSHLLEVVHGYLFVLSLNEDFKDILKFDIDLITRDSLTGDHLGCTGGIVLFAAQNGTHIICRELIFIANVQSNEQSLTSNLIILCRLFSI